jgi:hypothetical protein
MATSFGKSVADQDFGQGKPSNSNAKLMSTTARECADCVAPKNELKRYVGGKGNPSGPLGMKGREF